MENITSSASVVRYAHGADLFALAKLFDAYRRTAGKIADYEGVVGFLSGRLHRSDAVIFVAEKCEQLLGFAHLAYDVRSVDLQYAWKLLDLYVVESSRQHGIATQLVTAAERHAETTEDPQVFIEADRNNIVARSLYEGLGYLTNTRNVVYSKVLPREQATNAFCPLLRLIKTEQNRDEATPLP